MTTATKSRKPRTARRRIDFARMDYWQLAAICERTNRTVNALIDVRHELRSACAEFHTAYAEWHGAQSVIEARKPAELALPADQLGSSEWHAGRALAHQALADIAREGA